MSITCAHDGIVHYVTEENIDLIVFQSFHFNIVLRHRFSTLCSRSSEGGKCFIREVPKIYIQCM